jgi:hypothetical protein
MTGKDTNPENVISRFAPGTIVATPGALEAFERTGDEPLTLLARHLSGDWGDVPEEDAQENEYSISRRLRILSAYTLSDGTKVWLITEANRSATTFLLPSEY